MNEGKAKKYILYAVSEIFLVVIGILIALSLNNWNEFRKNRQTENKLLIELRENLLVNKTRLASDILIEQRSIDAINLITDHLDNQRPYHDSLDLHFNNAFFSPDILLAKSGFVSIQSKGFDIIYADELRKQIIDLFDVTYAHLISETIRLEDQFWPAAVLPIKHKHFRPADLEHTTPVDYDALINDAVYLNTMLDRRGFRQTAIKLKTASLKKTHLLLEQIEKVLEIEWSSSSEKPDSSLWQQTKPANI